MTENNNPHKNHRNRLKTKVRNHGLECLEYHEILELLLTYSIPRKDTNPIAHRLIENFGSFAKVMDANYFDLLKVDGIGPESALLINIVSSFKDIYNKSKLETKVSILNTTEKCVRFFRDFYRIKGDEYMVMAGLSKTKKVVKTYLYNGQSEDAISFDLRQIANRINDYGISSVVLFHTHPQGDVCPTPEDIATTQSILNVCLMNGIDFDDHIILNESEHFSFGKNNMIDKMKRKYQEVFGYTDAYIESFKIANNKKKD